MPNKKPSSVDVTGMTTALSESVLQNYILKIRSSGPTNETDELSRLILKDFATRQWTHQSQSETTLNWLANVVSQILDHKKALDAFGLKARANHRPTSNDLKAFNITAWVHFAQKLGYAYPEAIQMASDTFHQDPSTIRKHLKRVQLEVQEDLSVWQEYFLIEGKPLPPEHRK